jgi:hypothetical protein
MKNKTNSPEFLTILKVLSEDEYTIPLYQRNYAWTSVEISQLLEDIWLKFKEDAKSIFYLGTLVVYRDPGNGRYELIDGQQRHTTLNLINAVVRYVLPANEYSPAIPNLYFQARTDSRQLIENLFERFDDTIKQEFNEERLTNLLSGVDDILRYFRKFEKEKAPRAAEFIRYLYKNVLVIRVGLPKATNLNQYFEIMNNRGEQLEPHEILKAKLMATLQVQSDPVRQSFAEVWDACSQMDQYVQKAFTGDKAAAFGNSWQTIPVDYLKLEIKTEDNTRDKEFTLLNLLENPIVSGKKKNGNQAPETRFRSVVNFPNFLLHVLRLVTPDGSVSLDDKNLLDEFGCGNKKSRQLPDAISFLNSLLYYRVCFDRYIIKREEGSTGTGWKIQYLQTEGNYKSTFEANKPFIMIQSMLHVSNPGNTYKNWLQATLALFKPQSSVENNSFYSGLQGITRTLFDAANKNLINGTSTPIFLFNYLDFKLWEIYAAFVANQPKSHFVNEKVIEQIDKNRGIFNNFRFTQNNSVEHVAPQRGYTADIDHPIPAECDQ